MALASGVFCRAAYCRTSAMEVLSESASIDSAALVFCIKANSCTGASSSRTARARAASASRITSRGYAKSGFSKVEEAETAVATNNADIKVIRQRYGALSEVRCLFIAVLFGVEMRRKWLLFCYYSYYSYYNYFDRYGFYWFNGRYGSVEGAALEGVNE